MSRSLTMSSDDLGWPFAAHGLSLGKVWRGAEVVGACAPS